MIVAQRMDRCETNEFMGVRVYCKYLILIVRVTAVNRPSSRPYEGLDGATSDMCCTWKIPESPNQHFLLLPEGNRRRGRPKNTVRRTYNSDLRCLHASIQLEWEDIFTAASFRGDWRLFLDALGASGGTGGSKQRGELFEKVQGLCLAYCQIARMFDSVFTHLCQPQKRLFVKKVLDLVILRGLELRAMSEIPVNLLRNKLLILRLIEMIVLFPESATNDKFFSLAEFYGFWTPALVYFQGSLSGDVNTLKIFNKRSKCYLPHNEICALSFTVAPNLDEIVFQKPYDISNVGLPIPKHFRLEREECHLGILIMIQGVFDDIGRTSHQDDLRLMSLEEAVKLIQVHERARQGRVRAQLMLQIRRKAEKSLKPSSVAKQTSEEKAVLRIQAVWRSFKVRKLVKDLRDSEMIFLGMKLIEDYDLIWTWKAEKILVERDSLQKGEAVRSQEASALTYEKIINYEEQKMKEYYEDRLRNYFLKYLLDTCALLI
ncbi:uncharacterized protein LOC136039629 [Artemia franciscana]|uniref:uncharacterized protein LOC136039629 n=1 Tax=Artemia franciscana TaxID=6661 RepID=UPI0032DB6213